MVAAVERRSVDGEFRSNLHQGGEAHEVQLTDEERVTARAATKALGLDFAGVDILRSDRGPLVLEVNSSPGIQGVETASGVDVAGMMIEHVEKKLDSKLPRRTVSA